MIPKQLTEPSTFAGLAAVAQMLASFFPQYAMPFHAVTAVAGALAGVLREGKPQ